MKNISDSLIVKSIQKVIGKGPHQLHEATSLCYTNDSKNIKNCNIFIVTVPTPIDENKRPDLTPLISASKIIGGVLKKDDIVIYESTVYPGATEEVCVPILEQYSNLKFNKDLKVSHQVEYWDVASALYDYIPVVGTLTKFVRKIAKVT